MVSVWRLLAAAMFFSLSLFFAWAFYVRYWKYRDCIRAADSSCLAFGEANLIEGGMLWSVPCVIFFVLGLWSVYRCLRFRRGVGEVP